MKKSKFLFKRAIAFVISLSLIITSLVFAPAVLTQAESANTQEYQKFDFDTVDFEQSKIEGGFLQNQKDGNNTALKLGIMGSVNSFFYGDLDFDLKQNKRYKVSFDLKGKGRFYVALSPSYGYDDFKYLPNDGMRMYNSPDEYTHYEVEMAANTSTGDKTYTTLVFCAYGIPRSEKDNEEYGEYFLAESYIDNITVAEQVDVTAVASPENGTVTFDKSLYYYGDTVVATAIPNPGYEFKNWKAANENIVSDVANYSFPADSKDTFTPVFEKIQNNTVSYQKYDFDTADFEQSKIEGGFLQNQKDGNNTALKLGIMGSVNSFFYGDLDFDLKQNKRYKVSFDLKGKGRFYVALSPSYGYDNFKYLPNDGMRTYNSPDGYTHYEVEMAADASTGDKTYTTLVFCAYGIPKTDEENKEYFKAESYIDNITVAEQVEVTIGSSSMGTVTSNKSSYYCGDNVTITATGKPAYRFDRWIDGNGTLISTANPYEFTAKEDIHITPVFEPYDALNYIRDFDDEKYNDLAPLVASGNTQVEYVHDDTLNKTVAKATIKADQAKIAIPFIPKAGKTYRVKINYRYNGTWFCPYYNGAINSNAGPDGTNSSLYREQSWYFTQNDSNSLFYLWTTNLNGGQCEIYIDTISFTEVTEGDIDDNGIVDSNDLVLLKKYILGMDVDVNLAAANVCTNDATELKIDLKDLIALKKKLATIKVCTTYYVDSTNGNDLNSGLSENDAKKK